MSQQEQAGNGSDAQDAAEEPRAPASLIGALAGGVWKIATGGPRLAADLAHRGFNHAEKLALSTLKRRLDAVGDDNDETPSRTDRGDSFGSSRVSGDSSAAMSGNAPSGAAETLARMMEMSMEQTPEQARELLSLRILRQLVPDEARILAGLADGHAAALMHLGAGPLVGPANQRWIENMSPVGKECGVRLLDEVPRYLKHLRELDLLESDGEDKSLQLKYQLMEADTGVRDACHQIEKNGLRPKFFRRTIRMSETGKAFWAACEASEQQSW
ncbi:MAG: Abi-alpha family protein [Panacagrimonas sp.]